MCESWTEKVTRFGCGHTVRDPSGTKFCRPATSRNVVCPHAHTARADERSPYMCPRCVDAERVKAAEANGGVLEGPPVKKPRTRTKKT